jgi:hypothetical protein
VFSLQSGLTRRHRAISRQLLWILGSPRSGSTWLVKMLDSCPGVNGVNEPSLGRHLAPFASEIPGARATDFDVNNCTLNRLAAGGDGYFFSERQSSSWVGPLGRMICERFATRGRRFDILAIQEPNGSQAADMIMRAIPEARFLFLLRDGRDVVDSERAAYAEGGWMTKRYPIRGIPAEARSAFIEEVAYRWVWRTLIVSEAFERHPGPKLMVRYEDLRERPEAEMKRILEWLGVTADVTAVVEQHAFDQTTVRGPNEFVRAASPGGWRENLNAAEQEAIAAIMQPTLERFGYSR